MNKLEKEIIEKIRGDSDGDGYYYFLEGESIEDILKFVKSKMRQAWNAGIKEFEENQDNPYIESPASNKDFTYWFNKKYGNKHGKK